MSDTPPEKRPAEKRGVALFLTLGMLAGIGSCIFVTLHVGQGNELARDFGLELSGLAALYISISTGGYAVPVFTWLVGMLVTKAGRKQQNIGIAILWAAGALLAFNSAYAPALDPPPSSMQP